MADTKADVGRKEREELAPENRRALEWLEQDAEREDKLGEKWWDEFEDFLRLHRLKIRCKDEA
ncbi:MAG: hypothetical protein R6V07_05485 [Armatimonadota bacterium]